MINSKSYLQASVSNLDLITQQEVSTNPVQTPFIITATTSLVSLTIGVATTLSVIGRWYVKLIPLFRKLFPDTFKSDLDEWLEDLVYQLILRNENIKRETNLDKLKDILEDINNVVDLIELDPDELSDYLKTKVTPTDQSLDLVSNDRNENLSEIEKEANRLVDELEELHEVEVS